jgi:hypothetical protein
MSGFSTYDHTEEVGEARVPRAHSRGFAARWSVGQASAEAPRPETPCQIGAPLLHGARLDRAETIAVVYHKVWHARNNRATADGVTDAVVRGHRLGRSVAPPAWVRGATPVCERGWWVG